MAMVITALEDLPPLLSAFTSISCPELDHLLEGVFLISQVHILNTQSHHKGEDEQRVDIKDLFERVVSSRENESFDVSEFAGLGAGSTQQGVLADTVKLLRSLVLLQFLTALSLIFNSSADGE